MSPTILRSGPYRMFFYSSDGSEPPHVHVERDHKTAKFWLAGAVVAYNHGFAPAELRRIEAILIEHEAPLLKAWHDFFSD